VNLFGFFDDFSVMVRNF